MASLQNRLVEMVFSDWNSVKTFLEKMGIQTEEIEGQQHLINPNHPMKVGFNWEATDYTTRAVQLGFAIAYVHWTSMFPDLLSLVEKQWREKGRTKKSSNTPATN